MILESILSDDATDALERVGESMECEILDNRQITSQGLMELTVVSDTQSFCEL